MTVTINPGYVYLTVTIILMVIQVIQMITNIRLKKEVDDLWAQISVLSISLTTILQNMEKKIDGKQDKQK